MQIRHIKLEEIGKEKRRIQEDNVFKKNKKIPLLSNNKNFIQNFYNLNKSSTFPQIRIEQHPQPIYGQIPVYYNSFMLVELIC